MQDANKDIYLSVVIPAYNEEKRICATLFDIDKFLCRKKYKYEILVISDGSTDKTVDTAKKYGQLIKNLYVIDNLENKGKGGAVRQGILSSKGRIRLFMDADNSTSIEHFDKMEPMFEKGFDIVIGTRDKRDRKEARQSVRQPLGRIVLGDIGNFFIQILAIRGIWDTQCGFKGFTADAAESIFPLLKIDRWAFDVEILTLANRLGLKIGIVPVYWNNDPRSNVTFVGYLNTFRELFIIRYNLWRNRYGIKIKS